MMLRRTLEGASKCALRDLRREEWTVWEASIVSFPFYFLQLKSIDKN